MRDLENHMVIGPYYDETRPVYAPQHETCAICSGDAYPTKDTHMGAVCSACTTLCPGCGDWLCNDPAIEHKGAKWHIGCAIEDADDAHPVDLIITPAQCIALAEYSDLGGAA